MSLSPFDYEMMALALCEAEKGLYTTHPNPRVGCVLVKDREVIATGWHRKAGEGHAEVNALLAAGENAKGADCYVTLEPCSHFGRTPPCAEALIKAGVSRVIVAVQDPNPQVAGQGLAKLQAAGIQTVAGCMEDTARALNVGFFKRMQQGLPFVRLKMASSLDGRTALANGVSQWITGAEAREDVQRLRARSSAVVTGIETVLADNPSLNVRSTQIESECEVLQPQRAILDSQGRLQPEHKVVQLAGEVLVYSSEAGKSVLSSKGFAGNVRVISVTETEPGRLDLKEVLSHLGAEACNEVLVETGPTLAGAFIAANLVDELWWYQGGLIMGADARPALALGGWRSMEQLPRLSLIDCRQIGGDLRLIYQPEQAG